MKRRTVCVIGNSHAAAIKQAWSNHARESARPAKLTFFCAKAVLLRNLELQDGALVPTDPDLARMFEYTSGGEDRIDIAKYDAFLIIGLGFRFSLSQVCDNRGTVAHTKWGPIKQFVSADCFRAMIEAHLSESNMAFKLLPQIRSCTDAPIVCCPTPFRAEAGLRESVVRRNPRMTDKDFCAMVMDEAEKVGSEIVARHGGKVVWQDDKTVSKPGYTREEFTIGATSFNDGDAEAHEADGLHMNEAYGQIMLAAALKRLGVKNGMDEEAPAAEEAATNKKRRKAEKRKRREESGETRKAVRAQRKSA